MKLSLRHIEIFRAIMAAGSVTNAARLLFTSQPTISRELARLEQVVGLRLFDREGGRLLATAQALLLIEEVERAYVGLERIDRFAQAIRNFEHGRLAITSLPLFSHSLLPEVCKQFHQSHPGVSVSITGSRARLRSANTSGVRVRTGRAPGARDLARAGPGGPSRRRRAPG